MIDGETCYARQLDEAHSLTAGGAMLALVELAGDCGLTSIRAKLEPRATLRLWVSGGAWALVEFQTRVADILPITFSLCVLHEDGGEP